MKERYEIALCIFVGQVGINSDWKFNHVNGYYKNKSVFEKQWTYPQAQVGVPTAPVGKWHLTSVYWIDIINTHFKGNKTLS